VVDEPGRTTTPVDFLSLSYTPGRNPLGQSLYLFTFFYLYFFFIDSSSPQLSFPPPAERPVLSASDLSLPADVTTMYAISSSTGTFLHFQAN
jgi:hypothetical protein